MQPFLEGLVTSNGYRLASGAGIGTIDDLKRVSGDGIFWFGGHGGWGFDRTDARVYAVTTATTLSPENERTYIDLLTDLSLSYAMPLTTRMEPYFNPRPSGQRPNDYYAFTAKFVTNHLGGSPNAKFSEGSLVYMAACSSFDPAFRDAFLAKGAGVYFGWTSTFWPVADAAASGFLFDRLLGTNTDIYLPPSTFLPKENPLSRPFDYKSVYADMVSKSLITSGNAKLQYKEGSPTSGLLAPSIQYLGVDEEAGLLVLTGKFGLDPGEVKIGGVKLQVDSWGRERIKAVIPRTGPQSAGEVVVENRGRKSNVRRLSDWRPTFHWQFITGAGSLKFDGELRLHFRADVASFREEAGKPPKYRTVPFILAGDSFGELEASGTDPQNKARWEGVASISNRIALGSQNLMDGIGEIETETPFMRLSFFVVAQDGMESINTETGVRTKLVQAWAKGEVELVETSPPLPAMAIALNQDFAIMGDLKRAVSENPSAVLFWSTSSPQYPPRNDQPRSPVPTSGIRAAVCVATPKAMRPVTVSATAPPACSAPQPWLR